MFFFFTKIPDLFFVCGEGAEAVDAKVSDFFYFFFLGGGGLVKVNFFKASKSKKNCAGGGGGAEGHKGGLGLVNFFT